jgi:WD40 repeat protein
MILFLVFIYLFTSGSKPDGVWTADWKPDGSILTLSGDDSTLWIYDGKNLRLSKTVSVGVMVQGLAWHPKKPMLAIATRNGVKFWNPDTGILTEATGFSSGGRGIGWNYDGSLLALADGNGVVQIADADGKVIRSIPKEDRNSYLTMHWHPFKNLILTGGDDLRIWDTAGHALNIFRHRKEFTGILSVRWHPSGNFFAVGDYGHEKEGMPTVLQFWKADGTLIKSMAGHHAEIRNLRWNPDGSQLATAADGLRVWDKEGKLLRTMPTKHHLWALAWSQDSKRIASMPFEGGDLLVWLY